MKKIFLTLFAFVVCLGISAQGIEIYQNGVLIASYKNSPNGSVFKAKLVKNPQSVLNGHTKYVEIGGVKWATMNIGATSIADGVGAFGSYFAWGAIRPWASSVSYGDVTPTGSYVANSISWSVKSSYSLANAPHSNGSGYDTYYTTGAHQILDLSEDAAHLTWGGSWRMPTTADFAALTTECTGSSNSTAPTATFATPSGTISEGGVYWINISSSVSSITLKTAGGSGKTMTYKVPGILFVSKQDITKQLFFPAAGNIDGTMLNNAGNVGLYWSSSLHAFSAFHGSYMSFRSDLVYPQDGFFRYVGFPIRPVSD